MLHLLDPKKILPAYALVATATSVIIFIVFQSFFATHWEVYKVVGLSSSVSSVLIFLLFSSPIPRWAWTLWRKFSKEVYPELTGCWEGTITPEKVPEGSSLDPLVVRAKIRHSLLTLYIDFHGQSFDSVTLSATPIIEQGQHRLHYVYRSESHIPGRETFAGTAMLRVLAVTVEKYESLALLGQYFTERGTTGTIELHRTETNVNRNMSFRV